MKRKVLVTILIIAGLAISTPLLISENKHRYGGAQRIAVDATLEDLYNFESSDNFPQYFFSYLRVRVDDVILICSDKFKNIEEFSRYTCKDPEDPKNPYSYAIKYTRFGFFGFPYDTEYTIAARSLLNKN